MTSSSNTSSTPPDAWEQPQTILVILAHPDDPEFFCGATLARWARAGHHIIYALLTCGDKGANDRQLRPDEVCRIRQEEQQAAARIIGAREVHFLDRPDGHLFPDLDLRRDVVRLIRRFRPDILVTCDPQNLYPSDRYGLNHPDHRYAGQVVLDAVFPAAGNAFYFPELLAEGLEPHTPREVWVSLTAHPNVTLDVTDTWEIKTRAILAHKSQIREPEKLLERLKSWHTEDSTEEHPRYEERFRRIILG
ncbi:MAG: PIG-L family deacetylase [Anaerolineae bacterium]|nr:MAG: PIG-L family deacetylase [Anaerolineae bacterium]